MKKLKKLFSKENFRCLREQPGFRYQILVIVFTALLVAALVLGMTAGRGSRSGEDASTPGRPVASAGQSVADGGELYDDTETEGEGSAVPTGSTGNPGREPSRPGGSRMFLRLLCILAFLVFLICDLVCLRRLRRTWKETRATVIPEELTEEQMMEAAAARKRRQRRRWIILACVVVVLAVIVASLPTSGENAADTVTVEEKVISGTAEPRKISIIVAGAGSLSEEESIPATIPDVVDVEAYYVQNGDVVEKGDLLASLDADSVELAILELQDAIDALDQTLAVAAAETAQEEITAAAAGRVKMIYAEADKAVTDTVYEDGALMLLSLDGAMVVRIPASAGLAVNESVTVVLSDGTEELGRVATVSDGILTVTISDETAPCGDAVTVLDATGNVLGTGTLTIHSELKVEGYYGTVSEIAVSLNEQVEAGDLLLTLEDTGRTEEYTALLSQRYALEDQMASLYALWMDGCVYAEEAGIVSGIPEGAEIRAPEKADGLMADSQTAEKLSAGITGRTGARALLSAAYTPVITVTDIVEMKGEIDTVDPDSCTIILTDGQTIDYSGLEDLVYYLDVGLDEDNVEENVGGYISDLQPGDWMRADYVILTADYMDEEGNLEENHTAEILVKITRIDNVDADLSPMPTEPEEPADSEMPTDPDESAAEEASGDPDASLETAPLVEDDTVPASTPLPEQEEDAGASGVGTVAGTETSSSADGVDWSSLLDGLDISSVTEAEAYAGSSVSDESVYAAYASAAGLTSGAVSDAAQIQTQTPVYEAYNLSEKSILSVTPQEAMAISFVADEMDILSLEPGMAAEVTLDAVRGQSFEGVVTAIDSAGVNSGGNTKYTVEVTLERTAQMMDGMNASIQIVTNTADCQMTIPTAALCEQNGRVYVYTGYDEKTDTLKDPVEVETGVADENYVEILQGLRSQDTYYYRYAESLTYTFLSSLGR